MVKRWSLALLVLAMLAAPMLACGFPLPAGTSMMAVSKAVCADGESPDSCVLRQDAYQMMAKLNSASISDLVVELYIDDGATVTEASINGAYDYTVSADADYLGANVRANMDSATVTANGDVDDLSDTMFMIVEDKGYTSRDGGESWIEEELDPTALLGLSFLLGLSGTQGASLDLFTEPTAFTVTTGDPVEFMGQQMIVQTLTVDLQALLGNPQAVLALFEAANQMGLEEVGLDMSELGDPNQLAMVAAMLLPFLEGTEVTATLWIGADDGYIHFIDEYYALNMDLTATDPNSAPVVMQYALRGHISGHNAPLVIAAPEDATAGEGGLLGGSGLGQGLFGN